MKKRTKKCIIILFLLICIVNIKIYAYAVTNGTITPDVDGAIMDYYGPTLYISPLQQIIMLVVIILLFIFNLIIQKSKKSSIIYIVSLISTIVSLLLINDKTYGYRGFITSVIGLVIYGVVLLALLINLIVNVNKNGKEKNNA